MPHETKAEAETENEEDDEKDEYKYESLPSSPTDSDTVSGDKVDEGYGMGGGHSTRRDDYSDSNLDSDMEGAWGCATGRHAPSPAHDRAFSSNLLDSSWRQYDRETRRERFSQS